MRVMLSYSHVQKDKALSIRRALLGSSMMPGKTEVWIDQENMVCGGDITEQMHGAVLQAEVVVLLLSPDYVKSRSCMFEARLCKALNKRVVPVVVAGQWPFDSDEIVGVLGPGVLRIEGEGVALQTKLVNALSTPQPVDIMHPPPERGKKHHHRGSPSDEEALSLIEREGLTDADLRNMRRLMRSSSSSRALQDVLEPTGMGLGARLALMRMAEEAPETPK